MKTTKWRCFYVLSVVFCGVTGGLEGNPFLGGYAIMCILLLAVNYAREDLMNSLLAENTEAFETNVGLLDANKKLIEINKKLIQISKELMGG